MFDLQKTPEETFKDIIEIVKDQQSLERFQDSKHDSPNTILDGRVYAYKKIVKLAEPFIKDAAR